MKQSYTTWRNYLLNADIPFSDKAWTVYRHQLEHQPVYRRFCDEIPGKQQPPTGSGSASFPDDIPLIPVHVFRDAAVRADYVETPEAVFRSSGTSGMRQSKHEMADLRLYFESCYRGFSHFYDPGEFVLLAWLPGYSDNPDSSLVAMIDHFIQRDATGKSRFLPLDKPLTESDLISAVNMDTVAYLNKRRYRRRASLGNVPYQSSGKLAVEPGKVDDKPGKKRRIMLFGSAFGLLDLLDAGAPALPENAIVVETGGMKTRRKELSKEELRQQLSEGFGIPSESVHSEYGMAEMSSQAWDTGDGWLQCPPWLRITIRNPQNPMEVQPPGEDGLIGIMDLANVHSVAFFLAEDRGVAREDGAFQVLGRMEHAELRGCNFLME